MPGKNSTSRNWEEEPVCERIEALSKLHRIAWDSYNRRQGYEWRMSWSIWTGIAGFIALSVTRNTFRLPADLITLGALILLLLHAAWQFLIKQRNDKDVQKMADLESSMRSLASHLELETYHVRGWTQHLRGWWSHTIYVVITVALLALALVVNGISKAEAWVYSLAAVVLLLVGLVLGIVLGTGLQFARWGYLARIWTVTPISRYVNMVRQIIRYVTEGPNQR